MALMEPRELELPERFDPASVGEVWRVPYEELAVEAEAWARRHGIRPAADDRRRTCLLLVDVQNTFCIPGFELFVAGRSGTGAVDDNRRLCEFVYRNLAVVTRVVATMDTHQALQIFHAAWLVDAEGRRPGPYTVVTAEDVRRGVWRFDPAAGAALGIDPELGQRHLEHYTRTLEAGGKYALTIWPYHAMLGGIGNALVSAVEEAVFFHAIARRSQPSFQVKGSNPLTEHYSAIGPEVTTGPDGERIAARNEALVEELRGFDAIVVAGQARSHCVAWTLDDLLRDEPDLARRVFLLEDCTSPVVVPGVVDYTEEADLAVRRFAEAGMHVVSSTDPTETWLPTA